MYAYNTPEHRAIKLWCFSSSVTGSPPDLLGYAQLHRRLQKTLIWLSLNACDFCKNFVSRKTWRYESLKNTGKIHSDLRQTGSLRTPVGTWQIFVQRTTTAIILGSRTSVRGRIYDALKLISGYMSTNGQVWQIFTGRQKNKVSIRLIRTAWPTSKTKWNNITNNSPRTSNDNLFNQHKEKTMQDCTVKRRNGYINKQNGICYRLRSYGYEPVEDTYQPALHIPTYFSLRSRKRIIATNKDANRQIKNSKSRSEAMSYE